jgi:hypothetical protein
VSSVLRHRQIFHEFALHSDIVGPTIESDPNNIWGFCSLRRVQSNLYDKPRFCSTPLWHIDENLENHEKPNKKKQKTHSFSESKFLFIPWVRSNPQTNNAPYNMVVQLIWGTHSNSIRIIPVYLSCSSGTSLQCLWVVWSSRTPTISEVFVQHYTINRTYLINQVFIQLIHAKSTKLEKSEKKKKKKHIKTLFRWKKKFGSTFFWFIQWVRSNQHGSTNASYNIVASLIWGTHSNTICQFWPFT